MKTPSKSRPKAAPVDRDELLPEYRLDYSKSKANPYAKRRGPVVVMLDPDVSAIFADTKSVNTALRAIIAAYPESRKPTRS